MIKELIEIQANLKAPKGQWNKFGEYKYRSAEDILEAVKPHLHKHDCLLYLSDEMVTVGTRIYVKATATFINADGAQITNTAYAREEDKKKGMDECQVTGTASSYARKYALNGLFLIDDTRDADANEHHIKQQASESSMSTGSTMATIKDIIKQIDPSEAELIDALNKIDIAKNKAELMSVYSENTNLHSNSTFMMCLSTKKKAVC